MASNPRNCAEEQDEVEEQYQPKPGHRLPGWTVDALLEQGQEEEAGAELERLLQEGMQRDLEKDEWTAISRKVRSVGGSRYRGDSHRPAG